MTFAVPAFLAATAGLAIFILGATLNLRLAVLRHFNIPDPVSGGLLAALIALVLLLLSGVTLDFDLQARDFFLVMFFAAIGLNARFSDHVEAGKPLLILLLLTLGVIVVQNMGGVAGAVLFGYAPVIGVLFGSASLIGGHGTAIAWSPDVAAASGLVNAQELGVAVATLGLVLAALVGGPVARVLLYLNIAIILGLILSQFLERTGLKLPLFVPCLAMGIVIGNLRNWLAPDAMQVSRMPALALISGICPGIFLAMSLMALQLWTVVSLGGPILSILAVQTVLTLAFVLLALFPVMGGCYRASVLAAGFGEFALGATPTAIANMTAVTKRYGPSPTAFLILPLVSAFFVDIANAVVIQFFVNL